MYKHILIATDGSELAGKAVTTGLSLGKQLNAKITAVTATEPFTALMAGEPALAFPVEDYDKANAESAKRILDAVSEEAKKAGVACETVHAVNFPAEAIIDTAVSMTRQPSPSAATNHVFNRMEPSAVLSL